MPCGAAANLYGKFLGSGSNNFINNANHMLGMADDGFFKLGQYSAVAGRVIAESRGHHAFAENAQAVANGFEGARTSICLIRWLFPVYSLVSGEALLQTNPQGKNIEGKDAGLRLVRHNQGKPITIPKEDLNNVWKKCTLRNGDKGWKNGDDISSDGIYIEDPHTGKPVMRNWMDIGLFVFLIAARILSPIRYADKLIHEANKTNHNVHFQARQQGLFYSIMSLWSIVVSINLIQSINDLNNERDPDLLHKKMWEVGQAFVDVPALIFDFGVGSSKRSLAGVGAGLNILSAGSLLARNMYYYG